MNKQDTMRRDALSATAPDVQNGRGALVQCPFVQGAMACCRAVGSFNDSCDACPVFLYQQMPDQQLAAASPDLFRRAEPQVCAQGADESVPPPGSAEKAKGAGTGHPFAALIRQFLSRASVPENVSDFDEARHSSCNLFCCEGPEPEQN